MADTPTPNYGFLLQQPGTNRNTWGGKLNGNWSSLDGLLFTASTTASAALVLAGDALPKSGGTMTGNIGLPKIASAPESAGYKGAPIVVLGTTLTLSAVEAGQLLTLASGNCNITLAPAMAPGLVYVVKNRGAGTVTLTRGGGVALTLDGQNTNKNCAIGPYGKATLTINATNEWSVSGIGVS